MSSRGGTGASDTCLSAIDDRRLGVERHAAGQQLVEDDADRVQVRAGVDRLALRLLGREVLRRAHDRARLGHVRGAGAGDAEVGDLDAALVVDEHVLRLEVAVHDTALVREARGAQDLQDDVDRPPRAAPGRARGRPP